MPPEELATPTTPEAPKAAPPAKRTVTVREMTSDNRRNGKAPPARRDAAVRALAKLHSQTEGKPSVAKAVAESISADVSGEPAAEPSAEAPAEAPLATEVLEEPAKGEPSPERARILKAREEAKKRAEEFDRKRAERRAAFEKSQQESKARAEIEQREAALRAQAQDIELAKADPFKFLEKSGKTPQELVKEAVNAGDPMVAINKELEALRKWKSETEDGIKKWREQEEQRALISKVESFERHYHEIAKAEPQKFATIRRYDPDYITQRCRILSQQVIRETGQWPGTYEGAPCTQEELLTIVQDQLLEKEAASAAETNAAKAPAAPRVGPKAAATITGSLSARTSAPGRALTRAERVERAKGMMRAGRRV
jgi:hypothetical protein